MIHIMSDGKKTKALLKLDRTHLFVALITAFSSIAVAQINAHASSKSRRSEKSAASKRDSKRALLAPKTSTGSRPPVAVCEDGTLSYSSGHIGACSSHGGVRLWLR